jgi:Domain of unknown function (DUF4145)
MSFDVYGVSTVEEASRYDHGYPSGYKRTIELACRCHECHCTTIFVLRADSHSIHDLPKMRFEKNETPAAFGYHEIAAFPISKARPTPADTPEPAANFYRQAATAMAHELHDAAGSMFRKCLESVTRSNAMLDLIPSDDRAAFAAMWLKARITKLKQIHAIPPALGDLVDVIKEEGDGAVHDDVIYDKESAEALHRFTETFLEQTFTIPAQIAKIRKKRNENSE